MTETKIIEFSYLVNYDGTEVKGESSGVVTLEEGVELDLEYEKLGLAEHVVEMLEGSKGFEDLTTEDVKVKIISIFH